MARLVAVSYLLLMSLFGWSISNILASLPALADKQPVAPRVTFYQWHLARLIAFSVEDANRLVGRVQVLGKQGQRLADPQAGPIQRDDQRPIANARGGLLPVSYLF